MGDFTVSSANPQLAFVGKGLAEMVATDLALSKQVVLIDRERRNILLGEMEFSLSLGAESQMEAGRLLTADYLIVGNIVDMGNQILITCSMLKVETGEVIWTDRSLGNLSDYDALSKKLASSALRGLELGLPTMVVKAPEALSEARAAKMEEAIIAFSMAVDSYDRKDRVEAAKQIVIAKAIDPTNPAVSSLFDKLVTGSPRFQVEFDRYVPSYNPALLGFLDKTSVFEWTNFYGPQKDWNTDLPGNYDYYESSTCIRGGINMPFGESFGASLELSWSPNNIFLQDKLGGQILASPAPSITNLGQMITDYGVSLGLGFRISDSWSIGASVRADILGPSGSGYSNPIENLIPGTMGLFFGASLGFAARSESGDLSADVQLVLSNEPAPFVSQPLPGVLERGNVPIVLATNVTWGLFNRSLYINLRAIGDISTVFPEFVFRGIPGLEWWPTKWFALRVGYDLSVVSSEAGTNPGSGGMAGLSLVIGSFDFNINYIERYRPYRLFPGLISPREQTFLIGAAYSFGKR